MWIVVPELQLDTTGMEQLYRAAAARAGSGRPVRRSWWCRSCAVGWAAEGLQACWVCETDVAVDAGAPRLCA